MIDRKVAKNIWKTYETFLDMTFRIEEGHQYFRFAKDFKEFDKEDKAGIFYERGQSLVERQANIVLLNDLFASNFPCFYNSKELSAKNIPSIWTLSTLALIQGLYDGKNPTKLEKFVRSGFYSEDANAILSEFEDFKTRTGSLANGLFALHEIEQVLTLLYLEKNGVMLGQDFSRTTAIYADYRIKVVIATSHPVDCAAAHAKMVFNRINLPASIKEPIYAVLTEAVLDVRGKKFVWWNRLND
ncbi:hypothetical protein IKW73_02110 [Candidatus Saccharibacteria bacterium]|nr:hypothetical protein [Candidatus Saccharibacteria bacterium]